MLNSGFSWKHHLNAKPIPQFDFTNYLTLISRSFPIKFYYQTFSNLWVVWNVNFPVLASGLTLVSDWLTLYSSVHSRFFFGVQKGFSLCFIKLFKFTHILLHILLRILKITKPAPPSPCFSSSCLFSLE